MTKDIFGKALLDYQNGNYTEDLITSTNISDEDSLPLPYLFRPYNKMPKLEQKALQLCKGKVLDVGCGAGNHALWLIKKGLNVKAIDVSKGAIEVSRKRDVTNAEEKALLDETDSFDTILLLMNGTGIFQEIMHVATYLNHLKSILNPGGQILIDSSDIKYMFEQEDGSYVMDVHEKYYGELDYYLSYKDFERLHLKWLYLDFNTLKDLCESVGMICELVATGSHYDYLARIRIA